MKEPQVVCESRTPCLKYCFLVQLVTYQYVWLKEYVSVLFFLFFKHLLIRTFFPTLIFAASIAPTIGKFKWRQVNHETYATTAAHSKVAELVV